jgi:hypothetical protein
MIAYRCKKNEATPKGRYHVSDEGDVTLCGKKIPNNGTWYLWGNVQDRSAATCPKCLAMAQEAYVKQLKDTGNYVDRFFIEKGKQSVSPELCCPQDIASLFFEFLKREGAIKKVVKK